MMADRNAEILVVSAQKNSSGSLEQKVLTIALSCLVSVR